MHVPCVCVVCTIVAVESIMTNFHISVGERVGGVGLCLGQKTLHLSKSVCIISNGKRSVFQRAKALRSFVLWDIKVEGGDR